MSHLVFKPLAEDLTRLLDEFSAQFQVLVGENGFPIGGGPTIGERLFILTSMITSLASITA